MELGLICPTFVLHCLHGFLYFLQDNIRTVKEESERLQKPKAAMFSLSLSAPEPQLMYSTHTFKSREQVKEILQQHLAQVGFMLPSGRRHTVCSLTLRTFVK